MPQAKVTVGLRLGPTAKGELLALLEALKNEGEIHRNEDIVGALVRRAQIIVGDKKALTKLGSDARAHRARAKSEGYG